MLTAKRLLFGLICYLAICFAQAQEQTVQAIASAPIMLQKNTAFLDLSSQWDVLEDPTTVLAIDDVISLAVDKQFVPLNKNLNVSYTKSAYWLRLRLGKDSAEVGSNWWMELAPNMLDDIQLFQVEAGHVIRKHHSGDHTLLEQRQIQHRLPLFALDIPNGTPQTLYLRIQTTSALYLNAKLYTPQKFAEISNLHSSFIAIYYGIMLAMIAYNLILTTSYRDKALLYYLLFSTSTLIAALNNNGHLSLYFNPSTYWIADTIQNIAIAALSLFYSLFIQDFLQLKTKAKVVSRVFTFIQVSALLFATLSILGYHEKVSLSMQLLALFSTIVVIYIAVTIGRKGYRPGWIVLIATLAWLAGGSLAVLRNLGLIDSSWLTEYGFQIGSAIEIILLALAQADRIHIIKQDNAKHEAERLRIAQSAEAELEIKVKERTKALADAINKLELLNKEKNELLGIVAHDLKNPLTGMIGMSDILRKMDHQINIEQRHNYLDRISKNGERMLHIITNLLDVNALETGSSKLDLKSVNLVDLGKQALQQYEQAMQAKDIHASIAVHASTEVWIHADPDALFQILDNLISNAVKYSPMGKQIEINFDVHQGFGQFHIKDQGPGLSKEDQQKLFKKFTRLSSVPTAGEHSSGLGLSIVKKLSQAMGGDVVCTSRLGEGCTFTILLPLHAAPSA